MYANHSSPSTVQLAINSFPPDVFDEIASRLQFADRLSFLSCCAATRRYHLSTPSGLFPDLTFKLERPETVGRLAAWLADNKQHLGKLCLHLATAEPEVEAMFLLLLGALSGSSVHSLKIFTSKREVRVGNWLRMLRHLQSLHVTANQVWLGSGLSDLAITSLNLVSHNPNIVFPSGGLPSLLQRLSVNLFDAASLRKALQAAGPLQHLQALSLKEPDKWKDSGLLRGVLAAYTQLTSLTLESWELKGVPRQLAALTALQELRLRANSLSTHEASLGVLTSLTKLTKLCLVDSGLHAVPPGIMALPALKDLDLTYNFLAQLPSLAGSSNLTHLALDTDAVVAATEGLAALRALHTLVVVDPGWSDIELGYSHVVRILRSLGQLPSFKVLDATSTCGDHNPFQAAEEILAELGLLPFTILVG